MSEPRDLDKFDTLVNIIARLRGPDGCPWDREQTHQTLRENLLSECYEVLEALDEGDSDKLYEELGDLLLQIVLHAQIAKDDGEFEIGDVIRSISSKIVRRHPHIFGTRNPGDWYMVWHSSVTRKLARLGYHGPAARSLYFHGTLAWGSRMVRSSA